VKLPESIRLTYSNVVATAALFVALGGSAYALGPSFVGAGGAIQGCVAKSGGVLTVVKPGKRCPKGARSLMFNAHGTVPKATRASYATHAGTADLATTATNATNAVNATNATTAADAHAVGGITVRKIFFAPSAATPTPTTILSLGGLTLNASCSGGTIAILATPAVDHSHLSSEMWNTAGADGLHHTDYNTAGPDDLTDQNPSGETSFTYTEPDGTIVNGQLSFDSSNVIGGNIFNHTAACLVSGFAMSTASS
jgi:hypothetical protein